VTTGALMAIQVKGKVSRWRRGDEQEMEQSGLGYLRKSSSWYLKL
jgi:hypothetical protein